MRQYFVARAGLAFLIACGTFSGETAIRAIKQAIGPHLRILLSVKRLRSPCSRWLKKQRHTWRYAHYLNCRIARPQSVRDARHGYGETVHSSDVRSCALAASRHWAASDRDGRIARRRSLRARIDCRVRSPLRARWAGDRDSRDPKPRCGGRGLWRFRNRIRVAHRVLDKLQLLGSSARRPSHHDPCVHLCSIRATDFHLAPT